MKLEELFDRYKYKTSDFINRVQTDEESLFILSECEVADILKQVHSSNKRKSPLEEKKKKQKIPAALKKLVWDEYIGAEKGVAKCSVCLATDIDKFHFHCAHVVAEAEDGCLTVENLRPCCSLCNTSMFKKNLHQFKKLLKPKDERIPKPFDKQRILSFIKDPNKIAEYETLCYDFILFLMLNNPYTIDDDRSMNTNFLEVFIPLILWGDDFTITLRDLAEVLETREDSLKRVLLAEAKEGRDYDIKIENNTKGRPKNHILMTRDCVKRVASRSQTKNAKQVLTYLITMEEAHTKFILQRIQN